LNKSKVSHTTTKRNGLNEMEWHGNEMKWNSAWSNE